MTNKFDVGGVLLDRPFKIQRLGHFGFNVESVSDCMSFYARILGLRISDPLPLGANLTDPSILSGIEETTGYFLTHGSDHHSFAIFPGPTVDKLLGETEPDLNINQITWQVSSLKEVSDATSWLSDQGFAFWRMGRDSPGSNWNSYPVNVEGHINELYYGIEQIGWSGISKPTEMATKTTELPSLPVSNERQEVDDALAAGVDLASGNRHQEPLEDDFEIGGIRMPRPFKIVRVGPLRIFVSDMDSVLEFYHETMGLKVTEDIDILGERCVFLRANTEHHSIALYSDQLRSTLGLERRCLSFGFQVANYQQLKDLVRHLAEQGVERLDLPNDLSPGLGYSAYFKDPDGNVLQFYNYMEQIGWDAKPKPIERRAKLLDPWPDVVDEESDVYGGEIFLGPWN